MTDGLLFGCISAISGPGNGSLPVQRQSITWTLDELLSIGFSNKKNKFACEYIFIAIENAYETVYMMAYVFRQTHGESFL